MLKTGALMGTCVHGCCASDITLHSFHSHHPTFCVDFLFFLQFRACMQSISHEPTCVGPYCKIYFLKKLSSFYVQHLKTY